MIAKCLLLAAVVSSTMAGATQETPSVIYVVEQQQQNEVWHPYSFGYHVDDGYSAQHRQEKSDGAGSVQGSYGYMDAKGHYRQVEYVADKRGFRAKVLTNEPGTASKNPAHVNVMSRAPQKQ